MTTTNSGEIGGDIVDWRNQLDQPWAVLCFGQMAVETRGDHIFFDLQVYLNELHPLAVRLELYANGIYETFHHEMQPSPQLPVAPSDCINTAAVAAMRPASDYTARAIPCCDGVAVPCEEGRIVWQR